MNPAENAILHAWQATLAADPSAIAVIEAATGRVVTREALAAEARAIGSQLSPGLRDRRVVMSAGNSSAWLALFIALLEAGAVVVPVDPGETADRQSTIARHIGAAASFRDGRWEHWQDAHVRRDRAAALIKLTSGSTGVPRAVRFTADEMLADGRNVAASMDITPRDRNLAAIPFGHSYGLGNLVMPCLAQGTAVLVAAAPLPRVLAENAARWDATVFPAVPALLRLFTLSEFDAPPLPGVRTVISAGSRLAPELAQAFQRQCGLPVHGFYGSTETGGISYDRDGEATRQGTGVGTALDGVTIESIRGQRLLVTSAAVTTLGNRRRAADGRGQYVVPDRATLSPDGQLALQGRTGRVVKLAGRRLDLGELEHQLRALPGLEDALAIAHPQRSDELSAAVQTPLAEPAVRQLLGAHLPAWKIPRRLLCLPAFPLTARGKSDTAALRRRLGG